MNYLKGAVRTGKVLSAVAGGGKAAKKSTKSIDKLPESKKSEPKTKMPEKVTTEVVSGVERVADKAQVSKGTGKAARLPETEVKFNYNPKHDSAEFTRQLKAQEEGMNKLTVDEYLKNRQKYKDEGRALEGNLAQQAAREQAYADKVIELREKGLSTESAEKEASKWMDTQAALHNPDQIAGGNASTIGGMGDRSVNSSLGAQWKSRIDAVDEQIKKAAEGMSEAEKKSMYLNVKFTQ